MLTHPILDQLTQLGLTGMAQAFAELGKRPVVMAHPGYPDESLRALDPVVESRALELAYLKSDAFAELLRSRNLALAPAP